MFHKSFVKLVSFQDMVSERVFSSVTTLFPRCVGEIIIRQHKNRELEAKEGFDDLITSGASISARYTLLWEKQKDIRRQLIQVCSSIGFCQIPTEQNGKSVLKVVLDLFPTIDDEDWPMEEQAERYGQPLFGLTTMIISIQLFLSVLLGRYEASKLKGDQIIVLNQAVDVYTREFERFITFIRRSGEDAIWEKLDRFLATSTWLALFPQASVKRITRESSDHHPILLNSDFSADSSHRRKKLFRFEHMWVRDPGCRQAVEEAWRAGLGTEREMLQKISGVATALNSWNSASFGNVPRRIKQKRWELDEIQSEADGNHKAAESRLQAELAELETREEIMWKQCAKVSWLKEGDRNTSFFHSKCSSRRRNNAISGILNENGSWVQSEEEIDSVVINYFSQLFQSSNPQGIDEFVQDVDNVLLPEQESSLMEPYSRDEIFTALYQINPLKAPGPDGMSSSFYQSFWSIVGDDIVSFVLNILNSGVMPANLNHTFVALIPKIKNPKLMKDLRPIALCNVLYKLISKVLANRLKSVLPSIIHETQSAFVSGRLITDNAIIAFEAFHSMKTRLKGNRGNFALKLDMSKAYDRIEWVFLRKVLLVMKFPVPFVNLLMMCVQSVSLSFLINGQPKGFIKPARGLRQGDPISPYLFLICAEAFSSRIRKAELDGLLHGLKISKFAPRVSHLFFADDSLIFGRAKLDEINVIKDILASYERASGQMINFDKSEIFFSCGVPAQRKSEIVSVLGVSETGAFPRYLGLPTIIGRQKKLVFASIKDRIKKKLQGFEERCLSAGGKEVLIKAVIQAMPQYVMSVFLLPDSFCKEIQSLISRYWWGGNDKKRPVYWLAWEAVCQSKEKGGLGFRWLRSFNIAMLAKQCWRILKRPDSLCSRILKDKYFRNHNFLDSPVSSSPSFFWKGIWEALPWFRHGIFWRIGNGERVNIWADNWLPSLNHKKPLVCLDELRPKVVAELIDAEAVEWNRAKLQKNFMPSDITEILKIELSPRNKTDDIYWEGTRSGEYSVKSCYYLTENVRFAGTSQPSTSSTHCPSFSTLWKVQLPPKLLHFWWRVMRDILPTGSALVRRGIGRTGSCDCCGLSLETTQHALLHCRGSAAVWKSAGLPIRVDKVVARNLAQWFDFLTSTLRSQDVERIIVIAWWIWFRRNKWIHDNVWFDSSFVLEKVQNFLIDFKQASSPLLAKTIPLSTSGNDLDSKKIWYPPPRGVVKINCDASWGDNGLVCSVGLIARDDQGLVLASAGIPIDPCLSVEAAEVQAILKGLSFAQDCHFCAIIIESDAKVAIDAINSGSYPSASIYNSYSDIAFLRTQFASCSFYFVYRDGNRVAHSIASWAKDLNTPIFLMEDCPSIAWALVCNDVSAFSS